jgi:hypothetical protein
MLYREIFYFVLLESFETHKYAVFSMCVCMYVLRIKFMVHKHFAWI